ncbi:MAG: hypothetical protein ABI443_07370 [Chthoniobacterales bacterium]
MSISNFDSWYLRKYGDNEIFGPVHFDKIKEWAMAAQIAPHDMLSEDGKIWTKAPMILELQMDWLVQLSDDSFYGPTTVHALIEFLQLGEITDDTVIINCCSGKQIRLNEADFYQKKSSETDIEARSPQKRSIRHNLQQRVRDLELALVEKNRHLQIAEDKIQKLQIQVRDLSSR